MNYSREVLNDYLAEAHAQLADLINLRTTREWKADPTEALGRLRLISKVAETMANKIGVAMVGVE